MSGSGISWAICKSAPRSIQITMPASHHLLAQTWESPCPSLSAIADSYFMLYRWLCSLQLAVCGDVVLVYFYVHDHKWIVRNLFHWIYLHCVVTVVTYTKLSTLCVHHSDDMASMSCRHWYSAATAHSIMHSSFGTELFLSKNSSFVHSHLLLLFSHQSDETYVARLLKP